MLRLVDRHAPKKEKELLNNEKICAISEINGDQVRICYDINERDRSGYQFYDMIPAKEDDNWLLCPQINTDDTKLNDRITIVGQSGVGKSTYAAKMAKLYKIIHGTDGFIISDDEDDKAYKNTGLNLIKILDLMQMYVDDANFDIFKFLNATTSDKKLTLVIIDDCEAVNDKYKKIYISFLKTLFTRGRKYGLSPLIIIHNGAEGPLTKAINSESRCVFFSPAHQSQNMQYFLRANCDITKQTREYIKSLERKLGRLCCIFNDSNPKYLVGDKLVMILDNDRIKPDMIKNESEMVSNLNLFD